MPELVIPSHLPSVAESAPPVPDGSSEPDAPRRASRASGAGVLVASLVAALGGTVLLVRAVGWEGRFSLGSGGETMRPVTAACLLLLGLAVALSGLRRGRPTDLLAVALAVAPPAVCLLTLVGDLSPLDLAWTADPFGLAAGAGEPAGAGRMPPAPALGVLLVSGSVLVGRSRARTAQALAGAAMVVGAAVLLRHTYALGSGYGLDVLGTGALSTGLGLVALSAASLLVTSRAGYLALVAEDSVAGRLARRLVPVVLVAPVAGGLVVARCLETGVLDGPSAIGLLVTGVGTVGAVLVWVQARRLGRLDGLRAEAEAALVAARAAVAEREAMARTLAAAERRAREIIDTAAEAHVALDLDGRVLTWNRAAEEMFGWSRAEAVGTVMSDLVLDLEHRPAPGERGPTLTELAGADGAGLRLRRELEMVDHVGRRMVVEAACWTVDDEDGRTVHALLADLTGRRAAEVELRRANADLQDFAAAMAHDLRTPLTVIRAATELLATDLEADPATVEIGERWIARIDRGTSRGMTLIDDILSFSALRESEPRRDPVDLTELVRAAVAEEVAASARQADVEVVDCGSLRGDRALLCHLVSNLVSNALKHVPVDRHLRLRIAAVPAPQARGLLLVVDDNGVTLPADERESIFTMFQRGRYAQRTSGTGVGLAICRRVAEMHDGSIRVVPAPGGGNRFETHLATPVVRRPGAARASARAEPA